MNKYLPLKSMSEGDRLWICPRSIVINEEGTARDSALSIDANCDGQKTFSSYFSVLVVKKRGSFLAFFTQTAINVYRTFKYREFTKTVTGKLLMHPKVTFNAHTLCEHYGISTENSLSVIETLEGVLFGSPRADVEEVAEKVAQKLNRLFAGDKTFTSNLPFSSKPFYSISIMPTDYKMTDKFLAIDTVGFCHFKSLAELKQLRDEQAGMGLAANG